MCVVGERILCQFYLAMNEITSLINKSKDTIGEREERERERERERRERDTKEGAANLMLHWEQAS